MDSREEATHGAGNLLMVGLVVAAFIIITASAVSILKSKWSDIQKQFTKAEESVYENYEGDQYGSDVLNAISQFADDEICITVKTGTGNVTSYNYTDATLQHESTAKLSDAKTKKSASYIRPGALFNGEVHRDNNGEVVELYFEQQ